MRLQRPESAGPAPLDALSLSVEKPFKTFEQQSCSLPFGQAIPLAQIAGPTYLTAQTLVQQVAFTLSDRLWTYSPESFDLDIAVKRWAKEEAQNAFGYTPGVESMEVRSGAATVALGYIFSKDFDLKKRHIPQAIIASSSSLTYLRSALDQLSLLYSVASPFVAHVAAVDYIGGPDAGLVTDYLSAITLADDLGLGVISSFSTHESQHMSLLATVFSSILPTLHLYDGIRAGRETTRVIDALDQAAVFSNYKAILEEASKSSRRQADNETKALNLLKAFNDELGTDYGFFEYKGHASPEAVLVVFGTIESSLALQIAHVLAADGAAVGVIAVRVYRPFVEEEFIKLLPNSVKTVGVLGQVQNQQAISDSGIASSLYSDVFAAIAFSAQWPEPPKVVDVKYPRDQVWRPVTIAAAIQLLLRRPLLKEGGAGGARTGIVSSLVPITGMQCTFWNKDNSPSSAASTILGQVLSRDPSSNVTTSTKYDNRLLGGVHRTDIRRSKKLVDASYSVESAGFIYVDDIDLFKSLDILQSLEVGGKLLLNLSGASNEDLEKKLPVATRKALKDKSVKFYVLDPQAVIGTEEGEGKSMELESFLLQVAFFQITASSLEKGDLQKLSSINGNDDIFNELHDEIDKSVRLVELPDSWATVEDESEVRRSPADIGYSSFLPVDKAENEEPALLKNSETIAKGLAFREVFDVTPALRPDLAHQTWTVKLLEHRRLTPLTYDRNIMNLEFDLGDSGLMYNIGDSLGIHPRNDEGEVQAFIKAYGLDPEAIVETQSRESPLVLHASTIYQSLMERVDIFGRPTRQFYESLAEHAKKDSEKKSLLSIGGLEGVTEFKRRAEVDTITYADVLQEFPSAHPDFHDLVRIVAPLKRREYSIASCQKVTPTTVSLMIVTVDWVDPKGKNRFGLATRYLDALRPGEAVTVSLKPSVMKLPPSPTDPIIMAGLGTGLAPFRAFVQHRAWEKAHGIEIGPVLLYMGSRHQREEYCYGEEWEAYRDAGVITLLSCAFSRDQPHKIYIQDRMRETGVDIEQAYLEMKGAFYLCGPTWPVPDVTAVLEERVANVAKREGKKITPRKEIEKLKEEGRYVLEVY